MAFDAAVAGSDSGSLRLSPNHPLVAALLNEPAVTAFVAAVLGRDAKAVRAIAFDKTDGANWAVPWHQDRTIAVTRCDERAAVTNWTVKSGIDHCEPPADFLSGMLTLRWHLDVVNSSDGCLRVLPSSHRQGRLTQPEIHGLLQSIEPQEVTASPGSLLAMRPLLVHSSSRRTTNGHRRTLHVELAVGDPPSPLRWAA